MQDIKSSNLSEAQPALRLCNISHTYHQKTGETLALKNINLSLSKGEFAAIVGPSGCGKSTLLNILSGLITPDSGTITMNGIPFSEESHAEIGYMLQKDHLLEWRTIEENALLGLQIRKKCTIGNRADVLRMLKDYGLLEFKDRLPSQLSGGMRQRAALVRTLALSPDFLLLDEPFSALDYQTRRNVSADIGSIIKQRDITTILVTHDIQEAIRLSDTVFVLSKRPGTIKLRLPISFSSEGRNPNDIEETEEFHKYFQTIWKEVNYEE